jgi:hypothetical protein
MPNPLTPFVHPEEPRKLQQWMTQCAAVRDEAIAHFRETIGSIVSGNGEASLEEAASAIRGLARLCKILGVPRGAVESAFSEVEAQFKQVNEAALGESSGRRIRTVARDFAERVASCVAYATAACDQWASRTPMVEPVAEEPTEPVRGEEEVVFEPVEGNADE